MPSDVEDMDPMPNNINDEAVSSQKKPLVMDCVLSDENEILKTELLKLAASFDRGFGASGSAREKANQVFASLEQGWTGESTAATILSQSRTSPSLEGTWRMIWTTAADVLLLQLSPLFSTGAIHQIYNAQTQIVTNVIDFQPRTDSLLPLPSSLIRAEVKTRACQPEEASRVKDSNRVGLIFEAVSVKPVQLLGRDSNMLPLLTLPLPKIPGTDYIPGYFDVTYLDTELLIIRQNAPGGMFALLRVNSIDS